MLSNLGKIYKPINYRLDVMSFEYFDENQNKNISIPTKNLDFENDYFVVKLSDYELGFQKIIFDGDDEPTITMSKYDFININSLTNRRDIQIIIVFNIFRK